MPQTATLKHSTSPVIPSEAEGSQNIPSGRDPSTSLRSGRDDKKKSGCARRSQRAKTGWSPERRAKQSAMMRARQIWLKSTGPRTAAGKVRSAQNAAKPWRHHHPDKVMEKARRAQARYITEINQFIGLKKIRWQNELLKREIRNRQRRLLRRGRKVTMELLVASTYYRLCKNLDFWHPVPVNVNAPPAASTCGG